MKENEPEEPVSEPSEEPVETSAGEPQQQHAQERMLPPASFEFLILSLRFQAESALGLGLFSPDQEQGGADLPVARHSIDMLGILLEKTQGNLTLEEKRLLENSLTELRFRYVQASK